MTHRGPFQPPPFCDSVSEALPRVAEPRSYQPGQPETQLLVPAHTVTTDGTVGMREASNFPVLSGALQFKTLLI